MHRSLRAWAWLLPTLMLATVWSGCASTSARDKAANERALWATDRGWATAARTGNVPRLSSYWAEDAVNIFPEMPVARGREQIAEIVRRNRNLPGFSLTWEPVDASVADSGDLGYTWGTFTMQFDDSDGRRVVRNGHYVCIWRKQESGQWKCVVESSVFTGR